MVRTKITPIIFVINNEGYNVERYLHDMNRYVGVIPRLLRGPNSFIRKYNDIALW